MKPVTQPASPHPTTDERLLAVAESLKPTLFHRTVEPSTSWTRAAAGGTVEGPLGPGDRAFFDFGEHLVGRATLSLGSTGSHPDAPAWLRVSFAERLSEFGEDVDAYAGWISKGWIQSESLHVDVLPAEVTLPRRFAFRYLCVEVLDLSSKYRLTVDAVRVDSVTSADEETLAPWEAPDPELARIDRVACATLRDCMQDVFEDGPKRDRRLWMGDLRLQAKAAYRTYGGQSLVKRCLYLFAGAPMAGGQVGACLFLEPAIEVDDTAMFDYSLFFAPTLLDYWRETGDAEALADLAPTAFRQVELARARFDERDVVRDSDALGWCFVDWNLNLNKQASAQAIYIYCEQAALELARAVGDAALEQDLAADLVRKRRAARAAFWDPELQLFVSGEGRQVSWASQIWMVLADCAGTPAEAGALLDRVNAHPDAEAMVTPYLYHHYVDALLCAGRREQAVSVIRSYWGGMVAQGADTFWELYNPENPDESPYGGTIVNSYCHAWSCGPAYFLRG